MSQGVLESPATEQGRHWARASAALRKEFREILDMDRIRALHRLSPGRHAWIAFRQFALLAGCVTLILLYPNTLWIWLPAVVLQGFVVFSMTVLLHEVVHNAVFRRRVHPANGWLGLLYCVPVGMSPSQFTRWHLDHHAELGDEHKDPKRHHLTPKIVRRLYKALYMTPVLFPIYFRAARREAEGYEPVLKRRISRERWLLFFVHLGFAAALWHFAGWGGVLKAWVLPLFFVFPVAFTINRLGQHYDIEPSDPAAWGTILKLGPVSNFLFLWSGYHMEHHYFPGVPFYNLKALHRELRPVFERHPVRIRTYPGLLWDWFMKNKSPHVNWH